PRSPVSGLAGLQGRQGCGDLLRPADRGGLAAGPAGGGDVADRGGPVPHFLPGGAGRLGRGAALRPAAAGGAGPAGARADPCAGRFHGGADLGSAPPEHQPAAEGGGTPHRGREGVTAGGPLPETERFARLRLARTDRVGPVTFKQLLDRYCGAERALEVLPDLIRRGGGHGHDLPTEAEIEAEIEAGA